jgi:outer membrane usher protein
VFSPYGVFSQSGILGTTALTQDCGLRLDTTWRYDDERGVAYRAGDVINAGLPWTRPVRLGGFQVEHGFGLRPDLVTGPAATVSGTAAVPSSVDVFVNNFKIFSQSVDSGPFSIQNLPAISGGGSATLVLHDVTGKETTTAVPFFVSSRLLAPGAWNYAAEAGFARRNYGLESFDYDSHLVGSASLRAGLFDGLTVEAHGEGGAGLANGGVGVTVDAFQRAVVEASLAGSRYGAKTAAQLGFGLSTSVFGATLDLSTLRALPGYADLAEVTAPPGDSRSLLANLLATAGGTSPLLLTTSVAPPRALDRVSLTFPRLFDVASLNLSFVNEVDMDGTVSRLASLGASHNFRNGVSAFASVFASVGTQRDYGALAGLSYTFADGVSASTQSNLQSGRFSQATEATKSAGQEVGDYGWSVADQEGADRYARATAAYQTAYGRAQAEVDQYGAGRNASATGSAEFSGAAAWLGGGVALAPHISDSFAMVDAGAPGVTVLEDNRVIGRTDASGRLLAPNLRSFEDNRISIDPTTLPIDAQASATEITLRPRAQSGVVADFKVRAQPHDAEIVLVDEAGHPLNAGGIVERAGRRAATIGYDGRAYLSDLDAHNELTARVDGRSCVAEFDFAAPRRGARPTIGPLVCRAGRL